MIRKIVILLLCLLPWCATAQQNSAIPVQVTVRLKDEVPSKELIRYSRDRPLEIKDFKGRPDASSAGVAATYSGILMELEGITEHGVMKVSVTLTIYFNKHKSWMKREGRDARVLEHEQHHFDLTAIKACALAKAIAGEQYTAENVRERIKALQKLYTTELDELQQAYDRDTRHGTDAGQQAAWSERIAKDLAAAGCM